jgi:hypothetical protein
VSIRRDLQLAPAFPAGRISFSQLDRFTHDVEVDSEAIAEPDRLVVRPGQGDVRLAVLW